MNTARMRSRPRGRSPWPANTLSAPIDARRILDRRGKPTGEVAACLASGANGHAAVPSGASTDCSVRKTLSRRGSNPFVLRSGG
jgi:hypothetical protein